MEIDYKELSKEFDELATAHIEIANTKGFKYISQMKNIFNKGNALFQLLVDATENEEELKEHIEAWNKALEVNLYKICKII